MFQRAHSSCPVVVECFLQLRRIGWALKEALWWSLGALLWLWWEESEPMLIYGHWPHCTYHITTERERMWNLFNPLFLFPKHGGNQKLRDRPGNSLQWGVCKLWPAGQIRPSACFSKWSLIRTSHTLGFFPYCLQQQNAHKRDHMTYTA